MLKFVKMLKFRYIKKIAFAALFITIVQVGFASVSFSGIANERNKGNKFSLKNLNNYTHRSVSIALIKADLQFKSSMALTHKNNGNGIDMINSTMQFDHGNTTYIFPYKLKIKIPRDKIIIPIR